MSDIPPILHQTLAGRYVLKREIGRGGSATVYLAHDLRHERLVAIKVLHPELSHALGAQRFMREIRLTASLQHPHILPIHDSGEADEQLFYVMPYVEGESLRQRLGADNRLSVEEAVRIGREVAGALAYAHERGIVHRDIKPENILFSGGHAVLADFGIARAIDRASEKITQQGTITGTPAYMSPEQARDRAFDGRSDVYSLSCVLYEAIAGVPPYMGDTPQLLLQQRIAKAPPLLREYRHDVPAPIEMVIARALSISPDDRYDDARAFSAALSAAIGNSGESLTTRTMRRPLLRRPAAWAAGVILMVAGGAGTTPEGRDRIDVLTRRVDTMQYAVVPFEYVGAPGPSGDVEPVASGTYAAMQHWAGLPLANEMSVSDALRRHGDEPLTLEDVARIARRVRAGRAVWGRVRVSPDSMVVRAGVYDALTGQRVREITRVVHPGTTRALGTLDFHALVTDLLRTAPAVSLSPAADRGTTSYPAWLAFERAAQALVRWKVEEANAALEESVAADPAYPQANLWLAQLRFLRDASPTEWATPLMAASVGRERLDGRERALADALAALARDDVPAACAQYVALRARDSLDANTWVSLAACQMRDRGIVRSRRSPTGFAFRTSAEAVWGTVSRSLELAPEAFVLLPYERLRGYFPLEHNRVRLGRLDGTLYLAFPYRSGDTIAFAPVPATAPPADGPPGYDEALRMGRDRMLVLLDLLTRRMPESPDAFEALANLLEAREELTGTPNGRYSALSALERARMLPVGADQRLRLAVADIRLHLKLGDLGHAATTADSVLAAQTSPTREQAYWLQGIAAYTGHAALASRYERLHGARDFHGGVVPVPAAEDALSALLMRTALGICDDSSAMLLRSVDKTLASYVDADQLTMVRSRMLERPLMLAGPCTAGRSTLTLVGPATPVVRAEQLVARGQLVAARRLLDSLDASRRAMRPGSLSLDHVLLESWLHDALGDPATAAARLDLVLGGLPSLSQVVLTEPVMAASVGRSMAYRAELASRLGDPAAASMWAGRVLTVWANADPNLAPVLGRMRVLATRRPSR
ncbi:MAG: protein kinase [Gemmatimonadetes bacterium]|nr:protein kinase [Gemmatimonadota bacterium]